MIYLDTYPAKPGNPGSYQTLAHEMQHLMNFVTSAAVRQGIMDIWIDEGLSSAAEYIYQGSHVEDRYVWYSNDQQKTIALGNNFFVWGNKNDSSILDDYATGYLFFQWLRIQAGGTEIYRDIIGSEHRDYNAVTSAADSRITGYNSADGWPKLLETWLAANYINAASGLYGYKNEYPLANITAHTVHTGGNSISLLPGEGVYSITTSSDSITSIKGGSGQHIGYAALKKDGNGIVDNSTMQAGGALLTYNNSTNNSTSAPAENGYVTGIAASAGYQGLASASALRSGGRALPDGPVRIDARDMLARNGGGAETFDLSGLAGGGND
ncbi:MAG: hypothetical protein LBJ86_03955 [Spirochaetaceae bacterium]|nr:hypothetical protein [Spirochaetaceae bacterium]